MDYNSCIDLEIVGYNGVSKHRVLPSEIVFFNNYQAGLFGKAEVEMSAGRIVVFLKERKCNKWCPFTLSELVDFYKEKGWNLDVIFYGLIGCWIDNGSTPRLNRAEDYLVCLPNGQYCVTEAFIDRLVNNSFSPDSL